MGSKRAEGNDLMADESPCIDYENLPVPSEGIIATLFITVRKVAQSHDFYSRVLGGKVVLEENPCMVKLANSWIIMNPGGGPTPDKPGISVVNYEPDDTTSIFLNLRVADIDACYREWSERGAEICYASDRSRSRDPLLYARSGWLHDRGRSIHRPLVRPTGQEAPG